MVIYPAALDLPHALVEWVTMLVVTVRVTAAASSGVGGTAVGALVAAKGARNQVREQGSG